MNYAEETPLHVAAREGKIDIIKYYQNELKGQFNLNLRMLDGWTPFMYAAVNGYLLTVELLAEYGSDVNTRDKF